MKRSPGQSLAKERCQYRIAPLVFQRGAIVLGTGGYTYDRYVRDRSFCEITQTTKAAFAPTLDNPQCFVGYTCLEPSGERDRLD
jgi:hypothetical protein